MTLRDADARHFAALAAVADTGSFGRAAQRLGFSQSAVSQQIAMLERLAGCALFDRPRGPRRVALTPAGRLVLAHANAILDRLGAADDELARLRAGASGRLVIGTFQSVSVRILPTIIGQMRMTYPDVEIRLHEADDNDDLLTRLVAGELDLTFLVGPIDDERVVVEEMLTDPFVLVMARNGDRHGDDHGSDGNGDDGGNDDAEPFPLREILRSALIGDTASSCQSMIELALRNDGIEPRYAFRTGDNAAIQAMVRTGMGNAVRPLLAVDLGDPFVSVRLIEPPLAPRVIVAATVAGRTLIPAAHDLLEFARRACAAIAVDRPPSFSHGALA